MTQYSSSNSCTCILVKKSSCIVFFSGQFLKIRYDVYDRSLNIFQEELSIK